MPRPMRLSLMLSRGFCIVAALSLAGLIAGCGAPVVRPCQCVCPVVPQPEPAPLPSGVAVSPSEESTAVVSKGSYASAADGTGALSEQELLRQYEGKRAKQTFTGKATYYANSLAGRKTASGERYNPKAFTAAHRKLPFGTVVRVIRTDTNRYVYVRITDRGPFAGKERIIDLSYVAAERLGMIRAGVVPVRVEVLN